MTGSLPSSFVPVVRSLTVLHPSVPSVPCSPGPRRICVQPVHYGTDLRRVQLRIIRGALRDLRRHGNLRRLLLQRVHGAGEGP